VRQRDSDELTGLQPLDRLSIVCLREGSRAVSARPDPETRLETSGAFLTRQDLAALGLGRSSIDAVFAQLDVIVFPGTRRLYVRVEDFRELVARSTYGSGEVR
jgi:hypothetical protein